MSELLTGAQILCRTLVDAGIDVMFGYPGGAIMPFYDALHGHAGPRPMRRTDTRAPVNAWACASRRRGQVRPTS